MDAERSAAPPGAPATPVTRRRIAAGLVAGLLCGPLGGSALPAAGRRRRPRLRANGAGTRAVVDISAQLTGDSGSVTLQAHVRGTPSALTGKGTGVHHEFTSEARFDLAGAIAGTVVELEGVVTQAKFPILRGTPVGIVADAATGEISHTFGPITGGPLAGETLEFTGTGTVVMS